MEEEKNNKKIRNISEPKEEKELLVRGEIKTMEKDIDKLRETQAEQERGKIAKIKTEEEIKRDREKQAGAEKAALEREEAEKEARKRYENLGRLREEREKREAVLEKEEVKREEVKTEGFRGVLRETQAKEEEERKRFLERVKAKAEGKEEVTPALPRMPLPTPATPLPAPPAAKPAKIPKPFFKKPSFAQKLWIRIVLSLVVLAVLAAIITFWYWYLVIKEESIPPPSTTPPVTEETELIIPPALLSTESSQALQVSKGDEVPYLLFQVLEGEIAEDRFKRILIEDTEGNKILGLEEFFEVFLISSPENFYNKIDDNFTLFVYSQEEGNRLGFVGKINEKGNFPQLLRSWELTMEKDFENLFELFGKDEPALAAFKDGGYQEIDFRFQTFSRQDLGIVYSIFDDYFIFTTSWESMKKTLDKLKEEPFSLLWSSPANGAEFILENLTLEEKIGQRRHFNFLGLVNHC